MTVRKLVIIESGGKKPVIKAALEKLQPDVKWDIQASGGHIQTLNSDKGGVFGSLGIDKATLEMDYKLSTRGADVVKRLREMIKKNNYDQIMLATDKDREGEAIAEHLRQRLKLGENDYDRVIFGEITFEGIKEGIENPRKVDKNLTKAQDARRILDRVIGWEGTTAVSSAANMKAPMGRVISQAVKMIVVRDRERSEFVEKEHYGISIKVDNWKAELDLKQSKLIDTEDNDSSYWQDIDLAKKIAEKMKGTKIAVIDSSQETKLRYAPPPFETSTMHQEAFKKLRWKSKKTDAIAQKLYQDGHITYIRTDSTMLSDTAFINLTKYAKEKGLRILEVKKEGKNGKVAQEAHECIRPSSFDFDGETLDADEKALYQLIKRRCIASQLEPVRYEVTKAVLATDDDYIFKASGSVVVDKGWQSFLDGDDDDDEDESGEEKVSQTASNPVPLMSIGDEVTATDAEVLIKKTSPPPAFDESLLGKTMEKYGVGRPGTYTSTYQSIGLNGHGYVDDKGKYFKPLDNAKKMVDITSDDLCIMDIAFSASMEDHLNDIANGKIENNTYITSFFERLEDNLANILKKHTTPPAVCLDCGEAKLTRIPRKTGNSYFWGCKNTDCGATFSDDNGKPIDFDKEFLNEDGTPKFPCPTCKLALIRITSKKDGRQWWICSDKEKDKDKKCKYIVRNTNEKVKSGEPDFESQKSFDEWKQKIKDAHNEDGTPIHPCPDCGKALVKSVSRKGSDYYKCSAKKADCDFFTMADDEGNPEQK